MNPTYSVEHCFRMVRQGIDFAEAEGNFNKARVWVNELERAIQYEYCLHKTTDIVGGVELVNGEVVDNSKEICRDCGEIIGEHQEIPF